jgi:hypothetical protein
MTAGKSRQALLEETVFKGYHRSPRSREATAFNDGGYEKGPRTEAVAVPEPSGWLLVLGVVMLLTVRRRR